MMPTDTMNKCRGILNCAGLIEFVDEIGFLPLLGMGIEGWSAEEQVDEECGYVKLLDGGWEWPLWEWKGSVLKEAAASTGNFSRARRVSSARHGGLTSATGGAAVLRR